MAISASNEVPVAHRMVEINGIRMHYVTAGSGEPVVLLHGFPETWYAWRKIIPALATRHMVIAPDLRGCGDTDRPDAAFDKRTAAEDIHQLVQHLDVGPVNLVGHDVGTMVSYAYAAAYRNEIRKLAMMESALPGFGLEELYDADAYPRMYHLGLSEAPNGLDEALITGRELMFVSHFMPANLRSNRTGRGCACGIRASTWIAGGVAVRPWLLPKPRDRRRIQPAKRQDEARNARTYDRSVAQLQGHTRGTHPGTGRIRLQRRHSRVRSLPCQGAAGAAHRSLVAVPRRDSLRPKSSESCAASRGSR